MTDVNVHLMTFESYTELANRMCNLHNLDSVCSLKQKDMLARNMLSLCQQCGLLRSEKNVTLKISNTLGVLAFCHFADTGSVGDGKPHIQWQMLWLLDYVGRCYINLLMYGR